MIKWNRHRKKQAKIEVLKKRGISIIVKIQSGIFVSEEARAQLNGNIESDRINRNSIVEREVPPSAMLVDLTEDINIYIYIYIYIYIKNK